MTRGPIPNCPQPDEPIRERAWTAEQLLKLADRVETCNRVSVQREAASALRFAAALSQQTTNSPEIGSKLVGQQDGRVDAVVQQLEQLRRECYNKGYADALAQNAQGDDKPCWAVSRSMHSYYTFDEEQARQAEFDGASVRRIHAERARVPDGWYRAMERALPFLVDEANKFDDDGNNEPLDVADTIRDLLEAADSDGASPGPANVLDINRLQRWFPSKPVNPLQWEMTPHPEGAWVLFSDARAMLAAASTAERERAPDAKPERCPAHVVHPKSSAPGPRNPPLWCCLPAGHDGQHRHDGGGMYPSIPFRDTDEVSMEPAAPSQLEDADHE